jgi:hypothetical protein
MPADASEIAQDLGGVPQGANQTFAHAVDP